MDYECPSSKFKILNISGSFKYLTWNLLFPQTIEVKQEPPDGDDMIEIYDDVELCENSVSNFNIIELQQ
jgi:hypothetical protein